MDSRFDYREARLVLLFLGIKRISARPLYGLFVFDVFLLIHNIRLILLSFLPFS